MSTATNSDFLGNGGDIGDPFAGVAPEMTLAEQQADRDATWQYNAAKNAANAARASVIYNAPGGYASQRAQSDNTLSSKSADWWRAQFASGAMDPMDPHNAAQFAAAQHLEKLNHDSMNSPFYKGVTLGVLAAPAAITGGAGLATGGSALGFGSGEAVGGGIGEGGATAIQAANEAVPGAAVAGPGFTGAQAAAANAAAGASTAGAANAAVAGTTAAAAAPSAFSKVAPYLLGPAEGLVSYGLGQLNKGPTKEDKALIAGEQEAAAQAAQRRDQAAQSQMDLLGQKMVAFNPMNQLMAQMYGPQAAFSGSQMAQMAQNPMKPMADPSLVNYQGADPDKLAAVKAFLQRKSDYDAAEQQRQQQIEAGITPVSSGPKPIKPIIPQPAKRY